MDIIYMWYAYEVTYIYISYILQIILKFNNECSTSEKGKEIIYVFVYMCREGVMYVTRQWLHTDDYSSYQGMK